MTTLLRLFFQGLLVLLPAVLTIYLVWVIVTTLDNLLFSALGQYVGTFIGRDLPQWLRSILGLGLVVGLILLTGLLASLYLGRFLLQQVEVLLQRIPLVRLLYSSLSDLFKALLGDHRGFDRPVLVQLTADPGIRVAGFITRDDLSALGLKDEVAVYLPQSYNFAGNLLIVARERVTPIDARPAQVTTFIISGGVSTSSQKSSPLTPDDPPQKD